MLFLVAKKCQQEGLNPSKMEIGQSIQHVNAFFKRGKVSGFILIFRTQDLFLLADW
jgi:hypothetical protein